MALLPVEDAVAQVTHGLTPLPAETIALKHALGRVLAADQTAGHDQPPFAASAMDGYAVRGADVTRKGATLEIIGEAPAGHPFAGDVGPGQAVRIFTGAGLPPGADTVVIQEDTESRGGKVTVRESARPGQFVRAQGFDYSAGSVLIRAGTTLGPRNIALAASMNLAELKVRRKPVVAILATGDELVPPGTALGPGQIVSSNGFGMAALVARFGGTPRDLGIARDTDEDLVARTRTADGADILVTLGGASVGDHDLVQSALSGLGLEVGFWRIAMRPGKPLMFGTLGAMKVLGLPGNPVSTLVCAQLFLRPMMDALLGRPASDATHMAELASPLPENGERQDYMRGHLQRKPDGGLTAQPFSRQDSAMLHRMAEADCLIIRKPRAPAASVGELVRVLPLDF